MKILSFDATGNNIFILITNGDIKLSRIERAVNSNQSEFLTLFIEESLQEAKLTYQDLDLVAFTNGPASFTSVRIGYVAAKMINLCCNIDCVPVSNNFAIAFDYISYNYNQIVTAIDASLGDVFFQIFNLDNKKLSEKSDILLVNIDKIEQYLPKSDNFLLVGSAKELIKEKLKDRRINISDKDDVIKSENITNIAKEYYNKQNASTERPIYIREPRIGK